MSRGTLGKHAGLRSRTCTRICLAKGIGRAGRRRVALSHVSCAPSSNWTCGFPASSSPTIFFWRRAPQARQMAHSSYHLIQPTPFVQELIVPVLPSGPPPALVFASEPRRELLCTLPGFCAHSDDVPISHSDRPIRGRNRTQNQNSKRAWKATIRGELSPPNPTPSRPVGGAVG